MKEKDTRVLPFSNKFMQRRDTFGASKTTISINFSLFDYLCIQLTYFMKAGNQYTGLCKR